MRKSLKVENVFEEIQVFKSFQERLKLKTIAMWTEKRREQHKERNYWKEFYTLKKIMLLES